MSGRKNSRRAILFTAIVLLVLASGGLTLLLRARSARVVEQVPFSDLLRHLDRGAVSEVIVNGDTLDFKLVSGESFRTVAPASYVTANAAFVPELAKRNVRIDVRTVSEQSTYSYAALILGLGFVGALGFMMYRVASGRIPALESKTRAADSETTTVTFADVAGVDEAKEEVKEIVDFLREPGRFAAIGGRVPKGVLLIGPPGTGKTLLARSIAGEAKVPFLFASGSDFVEMYAGVGASRIRKLFKDARRHESCIIFIDELDAVGRSRGGNSLSHEEREQTLNQLLAEMDGFDSRKGVIIMGATNRPEVLDPALLRPGRFDRQVLVDKPDVKGREEILRIHVKGVKIGPDVDLKVIAARTAGFAGADLANLVNEAALLAARNDKTAVDRRDFESAIDRLVAGLEKKRVMSAKEREIVAYHESGHAIVATVLPGLDPVHKISIVQRGFGALGYTMQLPLEDRYLMTRGDLHSQLAVLLGGRTAEEIALGEISTGAQNDLQRATDIARAMVTEFGMSDELGAINYDGNKRAKFLDIPMPQERGLYAEETAQKIDGEIKRILTAAHDKAREILSSNRGNLEKVTRRLLEVEVMEGDELRRLLDIATPPPPTETIPVPPITT